MGKSRSAVTNILRILNLPEEVIKLLEQDKISFGHARALVGIENKNILIKIAKETAEKGLSVRDVEKLVSKFSSPEREIIKKEKDIHLKALEEKISKELSRKIKISQGKNKGKIEIEYYSDEDLENIIKMLSM